VKYDSPEIQEFIADFLPKKFPLAGKRRMHTLLTCLKKACKILTSRKLSIRTVGLHPEVVYAYAIEKKMAPKYLAPTIQQLNLLVKFFEMKDEKRYFPIPLPKGDWKFRVQEAYDASETKRLCTPITEEILAELKPRLRLKTFNFFYCGFYLGLRPSEMLSPKEPYQIKQLGGHKCLLVYQSKLVNVEKSRRWKYIPLIELEQKRAWSKLKSGKIQGPSHRLLQKTLTRDSSVHLTRYSPRKGFTPMMLEKGYRLEDISSMLGHLNLRMTLDHYVDHESVQKARIKVMKVSKKLSIEEQELEEQNEN